MGRLNSDSMITRANELVPADAYMTTMFNLFLFPQLFQLIKEMPSFDSLTFLIYLSLLKIRGNFDLIEGIDWQKCYRFYKN